MALVLNNRVRETTSTTGTGAVTLGGAVGGFQTFAAGIGNDNTTYYAISINTENEWEVGLGTLNSDSSTLTRTTVLESSNSDAAVDFAAGSKEVFCTLPSEKAVYLDASGDPVPAQISFKEGGTNFTNSLLVGHSTTGTLSAADRNVGVGPTALTSLTSGDNNVGIGHGAADAVTSGAMNTIVGAYAGTTVSTNGYNTGMGGYTLQDTTGNFNTAFGYGADMQNASGTYNVSLGVNALEGVSGNSHSYNTALGSKSLEVLTTGDYNIGIGYLSGDNITTGSGNVVLGKADVSSATGDDQLSISDGEDGSVVWMTGESTGNTEIAVNWNPSLSTTGKALVMGF